MYIRDVYQRQGRRGSKSVSHPVAFRNAVGLVYLGMPVRIQEGRSNEARNAALRATFAALLFS